VTATFAEELKRHSINTWLEILDHNFIRELSRDTLPMNKFMFYLIQDHYFLYAFSKFLQSAKLKAESKR
jgi:thiaminase